MLSLPGMVFEDLDDRSRECTGQLSRPSGAVAGDLIAGARRDHDRADTRDLVSERRRDVTRVRVVSPFPIKSGEPWTLPVSASLV